MQLTKQQKKYFNETVWGYYRSQGRSMPWRDDPSPYKVLVSELMLQQTQVRRVVPKFNTFLYTCSNFEDLAGTSLAEVLELWSGLGYNRRAKYLHEIAKIVMDDYNGVLPQNQEILITFPGIGKNTAGAIRAYAFNQPSIFVETNIRTVLFHNFYNLGDRTISDKELEQLVEQLLDREHPREWYWALMDYGSCLKSIHDGKLASSKHYKKQPPLKDSVREMRGWILRALVAHASTLDQYRDDERFDKAVSGLVSDGLVVRRDKIFRLTGYSETS
jgi:A/G-specific adenine glycosylase